MTDTTKTLSQCELAQFTGTEHWYRHALVPSLLYTDGVRYVAETAGAYWLLDAIALAQQAYPNVAAEPFQLWRLSVAQDSSATLCCEDGNGESVHRETVSWTDFPSEGIRFYLTDDVLMLPSEY